MQTQQYPQLPPGTQWGQTPVIVQPGAYLPGQPGLIPATPPPPGHGTGFWVGLTAAVAVGVVAALLIGFFIGKGSRLSNDSVQAKINQQAQADQLTQERALSAQKASLQRQARRLAANARAAGRRQGRKEGYADGQSAGYTAGQSAGYSQGQTAGRAEGRQDGFTQGLDTGSCLANTLFC